MSELEVAHRTRFDPVLENTQQPKEQKPKTALGRALRRMEATGYPATLNLTAAAQYLGISRTTLYVLLERNELAWQRVSKNGRRIAVAELERFARGGRAQ